MPRKASLINGICSSSCLAQDGHSLFPCWRSYQIGLTKYIEVVKSLSQCVQVTGVPVVKSEDDKTLVGVLSKKDLSKPGKLVKDVYSSPPIAARPDNKVADAACLMLKHKVPNTFLMPLRQSPQPMPISWVRASRELSQ